MRGVVPGRGPTWAPPEPVSPTGRRLLALLLVVILPALAFWGILVTAPRTSPPVHPVPFSPGHLMGRGPGGELRAMAGDGVLLYVDDACPFCAQELDAWVAMGGIGPTVVVSPDSDAGGAHVPRPLRHTMIHDADGSIARALDIGAVPTRALLRGGRVVSLHQGLSDPRDLARLTRIQGAGEGGGS